MQFQAENQGLGVADKKMEKGTDFFFQCCMYPNSVIFVTAFFTEVERKIARMVMQAYKRVYYKIGENWGRKDCFKALHVNAQSLNW